MWLLVTAGGGRVVMRERRAVVLVRDPEACALTASCCVCTFLASTLFPLSQGLFFACALFGGSINQCTGEEATITRRFYLSRFFIRPDEAACVATPLVRRNHVSAPLGAPATAGRQWGARYDAAVLTRRVYFSRFLVSGYFYFLAQIQINPIAKEEKWKTLGR